MELRQKTTSRPAMVRVTDSLRPTSPLAPATNQPPELRDWAVRSAAAMRAGLASRHVAAIRFSRGCGTRAIGIRERAVGLETSGSGLLRVLSDIGAPSLVKLRLLLERPRTCHHDAGRRRGLARRGYSCALGEDVVPIALNLIEDLCIEHSSGPDATRRSRWQHRDSCVSKGVESAIAFDLVCQKGPPPVGHFAPFKINIKEPKIILR